MKMLTLSDDERRRWQDLQRISLDDLYAALGSDVQGPAAVSVAQGLLIDVVFERTGKTIAAGRARVDLAVRACRGPICERWAAVRKAHAAAKPLLEPVEVVAVIVEVLKLVYDGSFPYLLMAEAIARPCAYTLDRFCSGAEGAEIT